MSGFSGWTAIASTRPLAGVDGPVFTCPFGMGAGPAAGADPAEDPLGTVDLTPDAEAVGADDPRGSSAITGGEAPAPESVDGSPTPMAMFDGGEGGGAAFDPAPDPAYDAGFDPGYTEPYQEPEPAPYDEPLDVPIDEASSFADPTEGY